MNNTLVPPCSMTFIMTGGESSTELPFDINKVPENVRDIVFNYLRQLQQLQLTILEFVEDEIALSEIGEGMLQLEKQFEKLMVEIIPQSDSEAEQSDSEAEQSDSEAEQSDSEAEQSDKIRDMTFIMTGGDRCFIVPMFDINEVPENLRDIVFNYMRSLQYLQLTIYMRSLQYLQLTIMEHVEDEIALSEIGEDMSQLEKQFEKLMIEIIPQSDSEAEQSDSEAEQSDSEAEQSDEIRDLKYELALKNKDHELLLKDLQLKKERSKSSLLEKEIKILNLKFQLTSLQNNVQ